ncbi:hypothetical protein [Mycolicibacterium sp. P1-18]|uniref:hypothetical protein n=1 Tax=Mycolicibacterium sp. P1-18 TaxID=2024615 RepID=UPI001564D04E|nr:hypothetical protein [Mycolicibacterium sp. P1-18]
MGNHVGRPVLGRPRPRVGDPEGSQRSVGGGHRAERRDDGAEHRVGAPPQAPRHAERRSDAHAGDQAAQGAESRQSIVALLLVTRDLHAGLVGQCLDGLLRRAAAAPRTNRHVEVGDGVQGGGAGRPRGRTGEQPANGAHAPDSVMAATIGGQWNLGLVRSCVMGRRYPPCTQSLLARITYPAGVGRDGPTPPPDRAAAIR